MEISYSLEEIPSVAQKIIKASPCKTLLFYGEMGSGKTTLIKEIVKQLGSTDKVSSPTFSLINEYQLKKEKIYHFDLYRIENENEVFDIGIEEYLDDTNWLFIEWPEKIESLLPKENCSISIVKKGFTQRKLFLKKY
ncbi:tRNA (adenosine(37)-N6)-threonylcarbamoyltransferase complex ATPase subunit type 1 TsaE [Mesonia maritima]|uniref:tRNA threonylcarbamoyladenosine biosynthesis protein TsaE n=1 Tax=Mesonia maritima TaxID=1793873 RepID=A0ABU1K6Z1_9FLAO|nr:tRNA (adenosine(37)-N6)-threonylcarbamoyltransferase complex ATPase subunit type 1 TsaE [Mesonia maritima]MDR6301030.1 tRNA threonylcarbamoyladenosine biosynthesis protein TsaE [Mesonia maritima]